MKAKYWGYNYYFKRPAGTSRGVMTQKPCYFIEVTCDGVTGRGECGILPGLSIDNLSKYENKLKELCTDLSKMDSNKWKFWAENNGHSITDGLRSISKSFEDLAFQTSNTH